MAFRVRDFLAITGGMIAHMRAAARGVTDFNIGAVSRVMLEAPAVEIDELYQAYAQGLVESIPVVLYQSFDFALLPAVAASGIVRISADPSHTLAIDLPVGFMVGSATGQQYRLAAAATIAVGESYADALAVCTKTGTAGNVAAGAINRVISSAIGVTGVTNALSFSNGAGAETPEERKLRFVEFVQTLARGTIQAVRYAAKAAVLRDAGGQVTERVTRATVQETYGRVKLWLHNGASNPSDALLQRASDLVEGYIDPDSGEDVPGYRPTGMRVDVLRMREIPIDVTLSVQAMSSYRGEALKTAIREVVGGVIRGVVNEGRLLPLDLENAPLVLAGVLGVQHVSPTTLVACPIDGVLVPGTVTVNWA